MRLAVVLSACVAAVRGASESQAHMHTGRLARYEIGPPTLVLSSEEEDKLNAGKAVMKSLPSAGGASRLVMVQDIQAPANIVLGRIVDFDAYDRMVSGVDSCVTYCSSTEGSGLQTTKATYQISALHLKLKYFVEHHYDPAARCVTFHLDYDRESDLDDSVGYWYAEPTGRSSCRVYYSCETKLRTWVPGPVYNLLTKEALTKATTWVEREAVKEFRASRGPSFGGQALVTLVANVRNSVASLELGERTKLAGDWITERADAAVRAVPEARFQVKEVVDKASLWVEREATRVRTPLPPPVVERRSRLARLLGRAPPPPPAPPPSLLARTGQVVGNLRASLAPAASNWVAEHREGAIRLASAADAIFE